MIVTLSDDESTIESNRVEDGRALLGCTVRSEFDRCES